MGRPPKRMSIAPQSVDLSWDEAIKTVLAEAGGALHYVEITDRIIASKLRRALGATPKDVVATTLSLSLREQGSPYVKVQRGVYALKSAVGKSKKPGGSQFTNPTSDQQEETGAVRAFGMFWKKELVFWPPPKPALYGQQTAGSEKVDFSNQVGVYLLHDRERVIYVGRAGDSLSIRLKAHTSDRLGGRWDRFSWFGLRSVNTNAQLSNGIVSWSQEVVISTMEALLIESLEPPLNRKRGDNFSTAEYLQAIDPQIEHERRTAFVEEIMRGNAESLAQQR